MGYISLDISLYKISYVFVMKFGASFLMLSSHKLFHEVFRKVTKLVSVYLPLCHFSRFVFYFFYVFYKLFETANILWRWISFYIRVFIAGRIFGIIEYRESLNLRNEFSHSKILINFWILSTFSLSESVAQVFWDTISADCSHLIPFKSLMTIQWPYNIINTQYNSNKHKQSSL